MPKTTAKNSVILINGRNFSTYLTAYEASHNSGMIDVTGFSDGGRNFIPGELVGHLQADVLWDSTTTSGIHAVLSAQPSGNITIFPIGDATPGNPSLSMPFQQGNYSPAGEPAGAVQAGTLMFEAVGGTNYGVEAGWLLLKTSITNTTTSTGLLDPADAAVTAICSATLHIRQAAAADTYVIKIQHSADDNTYADLITFTANGSAITSERQVVASGTVNKYRRVVATRTGAAGNTLAFTIHFWHA